jgi:hypothetical protein
MIGHCLCERVAFGIDGDRFRLYQCHCSLCRRQGGAASNAATVVSNERFRWLRGADHVSSWVNDRGFRSDFCATCGSPVPNPLRGLPYWWVPAGLLDPGGTFEIVAQLCLSSAAPWDAADGPGRRFDEVPELAELLALLKADGA